MIRKSTSLYRRLLLTLAMLVVASAAAMASVPRAPMGLRYIIAGSSGSHYIYLEWAAGDSTGQNISPYHVYQGTGSGGAVTFSQVATVPDSGGHGYYMVSPDPGVYTFYVTAFNNDGESAASNYVTVDFSNVQIRFDHAAIRDSATLGELYTYTAQTEPIAGDSALTFALVNPLPGMSIDPSTGAFSWVPDRIGIVSVRVRAYLANQPSVEGFQDLYLSIGPRSSAFCATIEGTVLYADGDSVRSGVVLAVPLDSLHATMRSGMIVNGHYSITVQDSAFYHVRLAAGADYASQWEPTVVIVRCGGSAIIDFTVDRTRGNTYDSASGYVRLRTDGSPVMAIITALDSNRTVIGTGRTDQNGRYDIAFRSAGPYYLHAVPVDSAFIDQYYDHVPTINGATLLPPATYQTGIDFDLDSRVVYQNSISGTLIGQTNESLDGTVTLYAIAQRSGHIFIEYSGMVPASGGSFSVSNLPPGTYVLFGQSYDSSGWVPGYYRDHHKAERDWEDATQLTIGLNTELTGIEIKLDKLNGNHGHGRVRGVITGEDGSTKHNGSSALGAKPIAGASIYAIDANGMIGGYGMTDANGAYEIVGLDAGVFTLQVDRIGYKGSQVTFTVGDDGSVGDVPVTLQPAESVSGVPVTGAIVTRMQAYPNPASNGVTLGFNAVRGEATVRMTDAAGFEVISRTITTVDGANTVALETGSLGSGLYFVTVVAGHAVMSIPVTIVR